MTRLPAVIFLLILGCVIALNEPGASSVPTAQELKTRHAARSVPSVDELRKKAAATLGRACASWLPEFGEQLNRNAESEMCDSIVQVPLRCIEELTIILTNKGYETGPIGEGNVITLPSKLRARCQLKAEEPGKEEKNKK